MIADISGDLKLDVRDLRGLFAQNGMEDYKQWASSPLARDRGVTEKPFPGPRRRRGVGTNKERNTRKVLRQLSDIRMHTAMVEPVLEEEDELPQAGRALYTSDSFGTLSEAQGDGADEPALPGLLRPEPTSVSAWYFKHSYMVTVAGASDSMMQLSILLKEKKVQDLYKDLFGGRRGIFESASYMNLVDMVDQSVADVGNQGSYIARKTNQERLLVIHIAGMVLRGHHSISECLYAVKRAGFFEDIPDPIDTVFLERANIAYETIVGKIKELAKLRERVAHLQEEKRNLVSPQPHPSKASAPQDPKQQQQIVVKRKNLEAAEKAAQEEVDKMIYQTIEVQPVRDMADPLSKPLLPDTVLTEHAWEKISKGNGWTVGDKKTGIMKVHPMRRYFEAAHKRNMLALKKFEQYARNLYGFGQGDGNSVIGPLATLYSRTIEQRSVHQLDLSSSSRSTPEIPGSTTASIQHFPQQHGIYNSALQYDPLASDFPSKQLVARVTFESLCKSAKREAPTLYAKVRAHDISRIRPPETELEWVRYAKLNQEDGTDILDLEHWVEYLVRVKERKDHDKEIRLKQEAAARARKRVTPSPGIRDTTTSLQMQEQTALSDDVPVGIAGRKRNSVLGSGGNTGEEALDHQPSIEEVAVKVRNFEEAFATRALAGGPRFLDRSNTSERGAEALDVPKKVEAFWAEIEETSGGEVKVRVGHLDPDPEEDSLSEADDLKQLLGDQLNLENTGTGSESEEEEEGGARGQAAETPRTWPSAAEDTESESMLSRDRRSMAKEELENTNRLSSATARPSFAAGFMGFFGGGVERTQYRKPSADESGLSYMERTTSLPVGSAHGGRGSRTTLDHMSENSRMSSLTMSEHGRHPDGGYGIFGDGRPGSPL